MKNKFQIKADILLENPFQEWEFSEIKDYFRVNFFNVVRISNVFYIKTYMNEQAVKSSLSKAFRDVYFIVTPPSNDHFFTEFEFMDKEIMNRNKISSIKEEERYMDIILEKIFDNTDISLEEKFFMEYYSKK